MTIPYASPTLIRILDKINSEVLSIPTKIIIDLGEWAIVEVERLPDLYLRHICYKDSKQLNTLTTHCAKRLMLCAVCNETVPKDVHATLCLVRPDL